MTKGQNDKLQNFSYLNSKINTVNCLVTQAKGLGCVS